VAPAADVSEAISKLSIEKQAPLSLIYEECEGVRNPETWKTLQNYMDLELIRSLFDPFLEKGSPL